MFEISNQSDLDLGPLEDLMQEFMPFAQERHGFQRPPRLFLLGDEENAANPLGKTGGYNPDSMEITIYVSGRHPKDILRSFSHELVHHNQNERGDLSGVLSTALGYAQDDPHMRDMEREAYEQGNLCFRDWEDGRKKQLQESIYYETIIGGDDMSEKKPLKEWKDNEINFRLMKKFGLIREEDTAGDDFVVRELDVVAAKSAGDEEEDDDEEEDGDDDDSESISGLGRNSTNETLSRLNEEVSHLLKEDWARRWLPGFMGGESSGGLLQSPEGPHIVIRNPAETRRGTRAFSTSRPIQPGSYELPLNVTGADVSSALNPIRTNTPMLTHGRFGGPVVRGDVFGTNPMEAAADAANVRMYGPGPARKDTISAVPAHDVLRQTASGAQERAAVNRQLAQMPGGAGTKQMSPEAELGWDAFLAADLALGTHALGGLHSPTILARQGRRMAPMTRRVDKRYRDTDLEHMPRGNGQKRYLDTETGWARPDNPAVRHGNTQPSVIYSPPSIRAPLTAEESARRLAIWRAREQAAEALPGPRAQRPATLADDVFSTDWTHDYVDPGLELTRRPHARWDRIKDWWQNRRGQGATDDLITPHGMRADDGFRVHMDELIRLYPDHTNAIYANPEWYARHLYDQIVTGRGSPVGAFETAAGFPVASLPPSFLRRALNTPAKPVSGVTWRVNSQGKLVPSFLNPSARARFLASGALAGGGAYATDRGYFPPDPRIGRPGSPRAWHPGASFDDVGRPYDMPYRNKYFRIPLDPAEQPKAYVVWDYENNEMITKRDFGDPEASAERWKAWNDNPNIEIRPDVYQLTHSPPAAGASRAPRKRNDTNKRAPSVSDRAPYIWEELDESLSLDEDFYNTLFEGVKDMWAKETKE